MVVLNENQYSVCLKPLKVSLNGILHALQLHLNGKYPAYHICNSLDEATNHVLEMMSVSYGLNSNMEEQ